MPTREEELPLRANGCVARRAFKRDELMVHLPDLHENLSVHTLHTKEYGAKHSPLALALLLRNKHIVRSKFGNLGDFHGEWFFSTDSNFYQR